LIDALQPMLDQLVEHELYSLFSTTTTTTTDGRQRRRRIRKDSIVLESVGEPHLVRYHGKAKGTQLHTDNNSNTSNNENLVYITLNVALSDPTTDFCGGGTYIPALRTDPNNSTTVQTNASAVVQLQQGEMLLHLGDLEHAGADITAGVRRLLVCFFVGEWEEDE